MKEQLSKVFDIGKKKTAKLSLEAEREKILPFLVDEAGIEDVVAYEYRIAHNLVDRSQERFQIDFLGSLTESLPGKHLIWGHDRQNFGFGVWYSAETRKYTIEEAVKAFGKTELSEAKLREMLEKIDKIEGIYFLHGKVYVTKGEFQKKIDYGFFRFVSIGFIGRTAVAVYEKNGKEENLLWYEWINTSESHGEATETSFVWLGAQQGAGLIKENKDIIHRKSFLSKEAEMLKVKLFAGEFELTEQSLDAFQKTVNEQFAAKILEAETAATQKVDERYKESMTAKDAEVASTKSQIEAAQSETVKAKTELEEMRKHFIQEVVKAAVAAQVVKPEGVGAYAKSIESLTFDELKTLKAGYKAPEPQLKEPDKISLPNRFVEVL